MQGTTLREIAATLGVNESRVSQIKKAAIFQVRVLLGIILPQRHAYRQAL
jgi:DNA-directed RNA polymerase specialized sigma subunit